MLKTVYIIMMFALNYLLPSQVLHACRPRASTQFRDVGVEVSVTRFFREGTTIRNSFNFAGF